MRTYLHTLKHSNATVSEWSSRRDPFRSSFALKQGLLFKYQGFVFMQKLVEICGDSYVDIL